MNIIKSQKNTQENLDNSTLNEVMKILNLPKKSQEKFYEKFWDIDNSDLIWNILKQDEEFRNNIELAKYAMRYIWPEEFKNFPPLFNNKQVCLIAVSASSLNYYYLNETLQKDTHIWEKMILSMINDGENYEKIIWFIDENFSENKNNQEKLDKFYKKSIKRSQQIYIKDINKCLVTLESDFPEYISYLLAKNILFKDKKSLNFSKEFYTHLELLIQNNSWDLNIFQRKNKIKEIIIQELKVPNNIPNKYINFLIETIQKNINISQQSKKTSEKIQWKSEEKKENPIQEKNNNDKRESVNTDQIINYDDDLNYYYPECNYTFSSWYYHIEVTGNKTIDLDENQMKNFTSVALKNFVKFYGLLYDLGLNFLWDKYNRDFVTLCNNKVWLDYTANEWITESKSLSILNLIGKNIWIPETKLWIIDDEGNEKTQLKCFNTIADAKLAFWDVKSTWKINGKYIMEPGTFSSYSIVEAYMIQNELVDSKRNSINISKFQ